MRVSIAMATYNGGKYLSEQLESFISQTRPPDELIVCDDRSTDNTVEVLNRFKSVAPFEVNIYINDINIGYTKNFEKAISVCSGDVIFLSDQDDVWEATKILLVTSKFSENSSIHVIINDAKYADDNLKLSGATVLQHVTKIGGGENTHIQGSCTAITAMFRDFILPLPVDHCPVHDVYIHRWAKLLCVRRVLNKPLQLWRIHGRNNSNTVFSQLKILSNYDLYKKFKNVNPTNSYIEHVAEFETMTELLITRRTELDLICSHATAGEAQQQIDGYIEAHKNRSRLTSLGWIGRKNLAVRMMLSGQYKYFYGFKSFVKDIIR